MFLHDLKILFFFWFRFVSIGFVLFHLSNGWLSKYLISVQIASFNDVVVWLKQYSLKKYHSLVD